MLYDFFFFFENGMKLKLVPQILCTIIIKFSSIIYSNILDIFKEAIDNWFNHNESKNIASLIQVR